MLYLSFLRYLERNSGRLLLDVFTIRFHIELCVSLRENGIGRIESNRIERADEFSTEEFCVSQLDDAKIANRNLVRLKKTEKERVEREREREREEHIFLPRRESLSAAVISITGEEKNRKRFRLHV